MHNCEPQKMVALAIHGGANHEIGGDSDLTPADRAFWERVVAESDRIATWAVNGLAITGRAVAFKDATNQKTDG